MQSYESKLDAVTCATPYIHVYMDHNTKDVAWVLVPFYFDHRMAIYGGTTQFKCNFALFY